MRLTPKEAEKYWDFIIALKIFATTLEFLIMEKLPKKINIPNLNNHIRKIKQASEAIKLEATFSIKIKSDDYGNDHAYALYRIFDKLMFADKDELHRIAEDLTHQHEELAKMNSTEAGEVQRELFTALYDLDIEEKKRVLGLVKQIKKKRNLEMV